MRNGNEVEKGNVGAQAAAGQDALEKKVHMLEAHQAEIHASLASMEGEAARLYQARPKNSSVTLSASLTSNTEVRARAVPNRVCCSREAFQSSVPARW